MITIGLTGGIASGKSTVATLLERGRVGVVVFNADEAARRSYQVGTRNYQDIKRYFSGYDILDSGGEIDRKKLGSLAFRDPRAMDFLEDLTWNPVRREIEAKITAARENDAKLFVLEAAVLEEAGWDKYVGEVWMVKSGIEMRRQRLQERNGLTGKEVEARFSAQKKESLVAPAVLIENNTNLLVLKRIVDAEYDALIKRYEI